jgi:hypothetical protein
MQRDYLINSVNFWPDETGKELISERLIDLSR